MRKLFLVCAFVPCVAMLIGCPKKKDDGSDAAAAEAAAPVVAVDAAPAVAAPVAKNVNDVARFPAEKPLTDDDQKTTDPFASAKTACKSGAQVAIVKVGTDPFKMAEFQDCVLITFPDPKDATTNLMGWVSKDAFTHVTILDAGIKDAAKDAVVVDAAVVVAPLKCPAGQEAIVNIGLGAICRRKCTVDKDCKTATPGACAAGSTLGGKITKVCANEAP